MDENIEKKPKRPRIGEVRPVADENEMSTTRVEKVDYNREEPTAEDNGGEYQGGYHQRGKDETC